MGGRVNTLYGIGSDTHTLTNALTPTVVLTSNIYIVHSTKPITGVHSTPARKHNVSRKERSKTAPYEL